ncbi:hypothetical protein BDB01DRAFT_881019, partial [Pilobolus umbonatus]
LLPISEDEISLFTYLNTCYNNIHSYFTEDVFYETNFKIKCVAPFLSMIETDGIKVLWSTPDILFRHQDLDIGMGEVKHHLVSPSEVEIDRIRIAEMLKKMLHKRISRSKDKLEFIVFGMMIYGEKMEYYTMEYNEKNYILSLLRISVLPTLPNTFTYTSLSLETLYEFKVKSYSIFCQCNHQLILLYFRNK